MRAPKLPSVMNFARHTLRPMRKRSGLSMGDLATALGVSVVTVSDWERGIAPMSREGLKEWCHALRLPARTALLLQAAHDCIPAKETDGDG